MKNWQTKKENLQFENWRFKIYQNDVERPDGKSLSLTKIDIKPGAHLVGLTADKKIPMIKQYRYPASDTYLEIPSGGVDVEKESFEEAAIREFIEEAGYKPRNVRFVARLSHTPSLDFFYEIYFSDDLETMEQTNLEEAEYGSEVVLLTYNECMENIKKGIIHDATTIGTLALCHEKGLI